MTIIYIHNKEWGLSGFLDSHPPTITRNGFFIFSIAHTSRDYVHLFGVLVYLEVDKRDEEYYCSRW